MVASRRSTATLRHSTVKVTITARGGAQQSMQPKTPSVTFEHDRGRSENGARCDAGHSLRGGAKGHFTHETDVTQLRFTPFVAFTRKASFCLATTTCTDAIALEALERVLPATVLQGAAVAADVPTERRRKLPTDVTMLLCVAREPSGRCRLPSRARRNNPRVVKRKMSKFALKRGKPAPPSQQLVAFETTIQILPQPAPQHQILDQPLPLDGTVDTPRSVQCLI